ncbi:mitochondrial cardiolipin hydrolase-like [Aphomia sociella]
MNWKTTLYASGSIICGIVLKVMKNNIFKNIASECVVNEVLLYGADNEKLMTDIGLDNLFCIYYMISQATRTIDMCVPSLRSEIITKCLVTVQQKCSPKIRIAIHNSDNFDNLKYLAQCGIEVKVIKSTECLEHEFVLIDATEEYKEAVAILGSLDYDVSRINCNRDATLLTSEPVVTKTLKREFDRVWYNVKDIPFVPLTLTVKE